jgi:hypothetical protein
MSDDVEAAKSKVIESLCRRLAESTGAALKRAEPLAAPGWSAIDASGTLAQTAVFARSRLGLV